MVLSGVLLPGCRLATLAGADLVPLGDGEALGTPDRLSGVTKLPPEPLPRGTVGKEDDDIDRRDLFD